MSASRCLRCAFASSRPLKQSLVHLRPSIQNRGYATESQDVAAEGTASKRAVPSKKPQVRKANKDESMKQQQNAAASSTENESNSPERDLNVVPPNVMAAFRTPLRLKVPSTQKRVRVADLQLRSYSIRNLEFFADFAMRVAQYLQLPAKGPDPLPKIINRWTVSKSNFVHKKTQENFERITRRRVIKIYNGNKETVEIWLACLRKWQFYGVGMKANVYDWEGLDVAKRMDEQASELEKDLDKKLELFGWNSHAAPDKSVQDMLLKQGARHAGVPMAEVRDEIKEAKNVYLD